MRTRLPVVLGWLRAPSAALAIAVTVAGCPTSIQLPSELVPRDAGPIEIPDAGNIAPSEGGSDGGNVDGGVLDSGVDALVNPHFPGYRLVFHDEFDGTALDLTKWHMGEGPDRDGLFSRNSVTVANGFARIATYTEGGVHHSGYISTSPAEFSYGYFEARVWLSTSSGEWCAFWTFPDTFYRSPDDPTAAGVELDVFEHRYLDDNGQGLWDHVSVGANWAGFGGRYLYSHALVPLQDRGRIEGAWVTFGVLWEPTGYTFYADDKPLWRPDDVPLSGRPAPVKLACYVYGGGWSGPIPAGGFGSRATSTAGMAIDWVRIWQLPK